jgi:hypothetical protein
LSQQELGELLFAAGATFEEVFGKPCPCQGAKVTSEKQPSWEEFEELKRRF